MEDRRVFRRSGHETNCCVRLQQSRQFYGIALTLFLLLLFIQGFFMATPSEH